MKSNLGNIAYRFFLLPKASIPFEIEKSLLEQHFVSSNNNVANISISTIASSYDSNTHQFSSPAVVCYIQMGLSIRPGLTTTTQYSGDPFPEPIHNYALELEGVQNNNKTKYQVLREENQKDGQFPVPKSLKKQQDFPALDLDPYEKVHVRIDNFLYIAMGDSIVYSLKEDSQGFPTKNG
ncbi:hypothetical protein V2J09_004264 [Rumex salicifolius]